MAPSEYQKGWNSARTNFEPLAKKKASSPFNPTARSGPIPYQIKLKTDCAVFATSFEATRLMETNTDDDMAVLVTALQEVA